MTYAKQLMDARWQVRRSEVMRAANFTCEECGMNAEELGRIEVQLTVHHIFYIRGKMLWEYPDALLLCACKPCHFERQQIEEHIYVNIATVLRDKRTSELSDLPIYSFFTDTIGRRLEHA